MWMSNILHIEIYAYQILDHRWTDNWDIISLINYKFCLDDSKEMNL